MKPMMDDEEAIMIIPRNRLLIDFEEDEII